MPADLDLRFLHGAELIQICLGVHQLQFTFPEANISVEGEWKLYAANGAELDQSTPSGQRESFYLHQLLGQRVTASSLSPPNWIDLHFDAGHVLRIFDSSKEFESFSIQPGNIFI